jgi:hypothetical protein
VARRDPDPTSRWNGDQDRSAFNVAAINADGAFEPIRILASFISTKIAPSSGPLAGDGVCGGCSTITGETGFARRASRFPSPLIDKAGALVRAPSNLRHHGPGLINHRQNLRSLF